MKCKFCKNEVPDGSIFCNHCGEKFVKSRSKKKEISVPKPRQQKSGDWIGQVMLNGQRYTIKGATEEEYFEKAKAVKLGLLEMRRTRAGKSLLDACNNYISDRSAVLSPSTIAGYETIIDTRFLAYYNKDILQIDWQKMINDEAALCSSKTLKNAWGFICSVLAAEGVDKPTVRLPQLVSDELPWLTPEQIPIFLDAVKGKPCEMAALFALHGLRKSEFIALKPENIVDGVIYISGTRVRNSNNEYVYKRATKNASSRRCVRIRMPRLLELLSESQAMPGEYLITMSPNNLHEAINCVCNRAGLPNVGCHGLRRSFASLGYFLGWSERETMREGGWSDIQTMHKRYIKLSDTYNKGPDAMTEFYENLK